MSSRYIEHRDSRMDHGKQSIQQRMSRKLTMTFSVNGPQKNNTPQQQNQKVYLRLESPRTKEAIKSLGLDYDDFQYKTLEDFSGPDIDPDVSQLRYDNYLKRTQKDIKQVLQKRKEIVMEQNRKQRIQQQQQEDLVEESSINRTQNKGRSAIQNSSFVKNQLQQLGSSFTDQQLTRQDFNNLFSKTTTYLKQSHTNNKIDDGDDIMEIDQRDAAPIEELISQELTKYNRAKNQKQLEAQKIVDAEVQRLKGIQSIKQREERIEENKIRQKLNDYKRKELKKLEAQEKLQKVKEQEQIYNKRKREERLAIKKKINKMKEKQEQEKLQRQELMEEKQRAQEEKRLRVQQHIKEKELMSVKNMYDILERINYQQASVDLRYFEQKEKQIQKLQETAERDKYKQELAASIRSTYEKEQVNQLISRRVQQEQEFLQKQQKLIEKEKQKFQEQQYKNERYLEVKNRNKQNDKQKGNDLKKKFRQVEENLQRKKEFDRKQQLLKSEAQRLKEEELKDIAIRNKRKDEYKIEKLEEKHQEKQEKINYHKLQKDFLRQTKSQISVQQKVEKNRIFDTIDVATKKLFPYVSMEDPKAMGYQENQQSKKAIGMLKTVLDEKQLQVDVLQKPKVITDEDKNKIKY